MTLHEKICAACTGQTPPLSEVQAIDLQRQLNKDWRIEGKKLVRTFKLKDFKQSIKLADQIAQVAEQEQHHPDLHVKWGALQVEIWTHAIDALSENDFILAAKIDQLRA